jgi:hypothetical protein
MADAAYGDELDQSADESVKESRQKRKGAALITLLRTKQSWWCSRDGLIFNIETAIADRKSQILPRG